MSVTGIMMPTGVPDDLCEASKHELQTSTEGLFLIWRQIEIIVGTGWKMMVKWTRVHTTKARTANMTAEKKQIALGNDVADMLATSGAEGNGACAETVARGAWEIRKNV